MTAEVYGIYCDPGRWRSGAGRALWREAMHQLTAQGYADVTCWVLEGNGRARRFYEAMGGVLDSGTIKMYEAMDVRLPEVRYRFTLPRPPTED